MFEEYKIDKNLWIDTRLTKEEIDFLWVCISKENKVSFSDHLAGNISKSELIKDKDNWFYETVLKKLTERMFCRDWNNYYKYHIEKEEPLPEFKLTNLWVNYQKQYEFNPIHHHNDLYSFVIFMKIPTDWKEQHALPFAANSNGPVASNFEFVYSEKDTKYKIINPTISLSPEDEGRMFFFPAELNHHVYPFYGTEEVRITISGNILLVNPNIQDVPVSEYEKKETMIEMLEHQLRIAREEAKLIKKPENEGKPLLKNYVGKKIVKQSSSSVMERNFSAFQEDIL